MLIQNAEATAATQHVSPAEMAKVVVVRAGDAFAMVVLRAPDKVDFAMLPHPDARLATENELGKPPDFARLARPTVDDHALVHDAG